KPESNRNCVAPPSHSKATNLHAVIPAKAGIHFALALPRAKETKSKIKMDSGFRRNDGVEAATPNLITAPRRNSP
ncbi:hypothetical protein, partial [Lysobacter enzymogenes]|uniref:hypothetical protein n=1 Tax=Lysobacter enzymogenes TaxID=69 RepID=UPI0019CFA1EE